MKNWFAAAPDVIFKQRQTYNSYNKKTKKECIINTHYITSFTKALDFVRPTEIQVNVSNFGSGVVTRINAPIEEHSQILQNSDQQVNNKSKNVIDDLLALDKADKALTENERNLTLIVQTVSDNLYHIHNTNNVVTHLHNHTDSSSGNSDHTHSHDHHNELNNDASHNHHHNHNGSHTITHTHYVNNTLSAHTHDELDFFSNDDLFLLSDLLEEETAFTSNNTTHNSTSKNDCTVDEIHVLDHSHNNFHDNIDSNNKLSPLLNQAPSKATVTTSIAPIVVSKTSTNAKFDPNDLTAPVITNYANNTLYNFSGILSLHLNSADKIYKFVFLYKLINTESVSKPVYE